MSTRNPNVLLVDDDPIILAVLGSQLRHKHGAVVLSASDGNAACRIVDACEERIDLLVLDINMPECDGIELLTRLSPRHLNAPIIFVTGAGKTYQRSAGLIARDCGFFVLGLFTKPVDIARFDELVTQALTPTASAFL